MFEIIPCEQAGDCRNSRVYLSFEDAQCGNCKYAQEGGGNVDFWRPTERGLKHPGHEADKRAQKDERNETRFAKRRNKSTRQSDRYATATRAEAESAEVLARAGFRNTVNSGRKNQDGDHTNRLLRLNLDTKHQEKNTHPVINVHELAKIRQQAGAIGHLGGLLLRNAAGNGFVVLTEEDFLAIAGQVLAEAEADEHHPLF